MKVNVRNVNKLLREAGLPMGVRRREGFRTEPIGKACVQVYWSGLSAFGDGTRVRVHSRHHPEENARAQQALAVLDAELTPLEFVLQVWDRAWITEWRERQYERTADR